MIEISESVSVVYEAFGENPCDVALKRRKEEEYDCGDSFML